jgi:hypothetical protein
MEVSLKKIGCLFCCAAHLAWDLVVKFCLLYRKIPCFSACADSCESTCPDEDENDDSGPCDPKQKPEPQVDPSKPQ